MQYDTKILLYSLRCANERRANEWCRDGGGLILYIFFFFGKTFYDALFRTRYDRGRTDDGRSGVQGRKNEYYRTLLYRRRV